MPAKAQRVFFKKIHYHTKLVFVLKILFPLLVCFYLVKTASGSGEQVKTPVKLPDYGKNV